MARKETKKARGVFERPKDSGVWWINYYASGKQQNGCDSGAAGSHRGLRRIDQFGPCMVARSFGTNNISFINSTLHRI